MSRNTADAELIRLIAVELSILEGEVWTADLSEYYADHLQNEKGDRLYIEATATRIYTSPSQPQGITRNMYDYSKISADRKRGPEAIARDISRRLMPEARTYWQKCRNEQDRHDRKVQAIREVCARLESCGMKRRTWSRDDDSEQAELYGNNIKATMYSDAEIYNFEISHIKPETAIQILKILNQETNQERKPK